MLNFRHLFAKKAPPKAEPSHSALPKMDLSAMDHCVGGRMETDGVGCYLRSVPPPAH